MPSPSLKTPASRRDHERREHQDITPAMSGNNNYLESTLAYCMLRDGDGSLIGLELTMIASGSCLLNPLPSNVPD